MENAMKYMVVLCVILLFFNDIVVSVVCIHIRERRQATPEYAAGNDNDNADDADYKSPDAGAVDNADKLDDTGDAAPKETPLDTDTDFGGDDFTAPAPESPPKKTTSSAEERSAELKKLKKAKKRNKFVRDVIKYLKKVLTPQNLMQNQWVTEMLRKFSNSADDDYKSVESIEEHTQKPAKKRRGRPRGRRSRKKLPKGLKGLLAYGLRTVSEIDSRKLRRNLRYVRRIARKAKKPLKTAVKILLSSRANGGMGGGDTGFGGGGGGGGYGNTY